MKIKKISVKNFLGVNEFEMEAKKINILKGPKGCAKSSVLEGIEKGIVNNNRRTELVKHGETESCLYIELDNGLEIDRRIRTDKADYLKIRKGTEGVPNTEKFLRSLVNGDIFRPLDWVRLSPKEQTKSILNMLQIEWSQADIDKWFGEIPSNIEYSQHILMVLKAIETKYYNDRQEVNRQINELKTQIEVIKKDLPANYNGEEWKDKKVQEYYNKVSEAQKINQWIEQARTLQESFETKVQAIKANGESDKSRINLKYKDQRQDIKDLIELSKTKIEKAKDFINSSEEKVDIELSKLDAKLEAEYQELLDKYRTLKDEKAKQIMAEAESQKDIISINENKIAAKEQELISTDSLEEQELNTINEKITSEIEKEKIRVGKAATYLEENEPVDIEPLQRAADEVANMQSFSRQWESMIDIRDNKLSAKERESNTLTARIEKARTLPSELLKTAKMPIEGISVDEKGLIRINGTLIDGLSEGEQFELAMKIAKAQAGELKIICLDGFEKVTSERAKILEEALTDEFQYFITENVEGSEMKVENLA